MDEVTGQWYYARWLGGGCRLVPGDESSGDGGAKGVVFSEGKLKIPLHFSSEGWWEGPPESGLRLCRRERYLVLHRRKGDKGQFSEMCAANSKCRAACLCYMSPLQGRSLRPGKVDPAATLVPPVPPVTRMIQEAEYVTEPQCIPQKPCVARDREAAEKDEAAEKEKEEPPVPAEKEPSSTQSEAGSQDGLGSEDFWPEPEAEGLPEQPSTAANPEHLINTEELPETTSDERLVQHPQIGAYCLGVTSRGHSPGAKTNVILLGEPPILRRDPPSKEVIESLGAVPESDYPEGASDAADVNLAIMSEEELESPRTPPQSPKFERVVAEVEDLRTTIHGLLAVPEHAELPDVPCPMAPSKSDASLLHGGSVIFDGGYQKTWPGQDNDIPQEVSILHRESAQVCEFPIEQLGSVVSGAANVTSLGEEEEPDDDPRRGGGAGLVRSHKVSGHL